MGAARAVNSCPTSASMQQLCRVEFPYTRVPRRAYHPKDNGEAIWQAKAVADTGQAARCPVQVSPWPSSSSFSSSLDGGVVEVERSPALGEHARVGGPARTCAQNAGPPVPSGADPLWVRLPFVQVLEDHVSVVAAEPGPHTTAATACRVHRVLGVEPIPQLPFGVAETLCLSRSRQDRPIQGVLRCRGVRWCGAVVSGVRGPAEGRCPGGGGVLFVEVPVGALAVSAAFSCQGGGDPGGGGGVLSGVRGVVDGEVGAGGEGGVLLGAVPDEGVEASVGARGGGLATVVMPLFCGCAGLLPRAVPGLARRP